MTDTVKLVSPKAAADLTSLSPRHLSRLVEAGQFPSPIRLGVGRNGRLAYVESEVQAWLRAAVAKRGEAA
jgi:prophage regulatory protein